MWDCKQMLLARMPLTNHLAHLHRVLAWSAGAIDPVALQQERRLRTNTAVAAAACSPKVPVHASALTQASAQPAACTLASEGQVVRHGCN